MHSENNSFIIYYGITSTYNLKSVPILFSFKSPVDLMFELQFVEDM
jgi:hypothetical protein